MSGGNARGGSDCLMLLTDAQFEAFRELKGGCDFARPAGKHNIRTSTVCRQAAYLT